MAYYGGGGSGDDDAKKGEMDDTWNQAAQMTYDIRGEDEEREMPVGMENELYINGKPIVLSEVNKDLKLETGEEDDEPDSCWTSFKRGVRKIWFTRQTEDVDDNVDLYVKTTLRELITFSFFLAIISVIAFIALNPLTFFFSDRMIKVFTDVPFQTDLTPRGNYFDIQSFNDFWVFVQGPMLQGLYGGNWNINGTQDYVLYEAKLLGPARIRQLRVTNNSCSIPSYFANQITTCYDNFYPAVEDRNFMPYNSSYAMNASAPTAQPGNQPPNPWMYWSADQLQTQQYTTEIAVYTGTGYIALLGPNMTASQATIAMLMQNLWVDRGTRAVLVEFTVYNANINLFSFVTLVLEFPSSGGILPSYSVRTLKLLRYVSGIDYFLLACEFIFCAFVLYYLIEEFLEIKKNGCRYFTWFWSWVDIVILLMSIVCIGFDVYRNQTVSSMLANFVLTPSQYMDFSFITYWQMQFNYVIAFGLFLSWIKIFKYVNFSKTMTQLQNTLGACAMDLLGFTIMFFIVFFAFAQLGFLIFGGQIAGFRSFSESILTLFRMILGDFDFDELEQANSFLGPLYFIVYIFFCFFVLINMFIAIIIDTYSETKAEERKKKATQEYDVSTVLKNTYESFVNKIRGKRNKIVDIRQAIQEAGIDVTGEIDTEQLRTTMKKRGYADCEIDALIAKLEKEEARLSDMDILENDLERQKADALVGNRETADAKEREAKLRQRREARVTSEEMGSVKARIDRMENTVSTVISSIESVIKKLDYVEQAKTDKKKKLIKGRPLTASSSSTTSSSKS